MPQARKVDEERGWTPAPKWLLGVVLVSLWFPYVRFVVSYCSTIVVVARIRISRYAPATSRPQRDLQMKCRIALGMMLLLSIAGFTQNKPAAPSESGSSPMPLTFGDAQVTIPAGWKHVERQSGLTKFMLLIPPDITKENKFGVLLLPGQDLQGADFPQTFDRILKQGLAANEHLVEYSEVPARKDAGYDLLARVMVVANDAGHRSFRMCFAANPRHRLEMMIVSADSQEMLKHYQPELALLLKSWSFGEAPAPAGPKEEESGAAHVPADAEERGRTGSGSKVPPGTRSQVPDGDSVLLCSDPARLDAAMDFAKYGNSYAALQALRNDAFFRVTGPARLEVKEFEMKSRWPKVLVTVLDGYAAGRTGWVVLSELKDVKAPAK